MAKSKLEKIRSGNLTALDNVTSSIRKINASKSNAFVEINGPGAVKAALEIDKKIAAGTAGKLAGLVVGVKSNINVEGFRATCASKTLENYVAPFDADVIKSLREEDAIIIGMTNMDEFAAGGSGETSCHGETQNPAAPGLIPGGSSSGSAAAVSEGLVDLALGSDTGGSIRNPASHCGIVGIKPTYGQVSRYGLIDLAMSLDQIGAFASNVDDAALLLEVLSKPTTKDATYSAPGQFKSEGLDSKVSKFRIGVSKDFENVTLDNRIYKAVTDAIERLGETQDIEVVEIDLPYVEKALDAYYLINYVEFFSATRKFDGVRYGQKIEDVCGDEVLRRILLGSYISQKEVIETYYQKALEARSIIANAFKDAFEKCDVIVSPTVPKLPHYLTDTLTPEDMYSYDFLTIPANLAGVCAGVVPIDRLNNIPVGLQVHANRFEEDKLIKVMKAFEEVSNYGKR